MRIMMLLIAATILSSCDYGDKRLVVHNSSMDTIFFTTFGNSPIVESTQPYYYRKPPNNKNWKEHCLVSGERENSSVINISWEDYINERIPDKKLKVLFFKKQFLDTTDWEEVVRGQMYSKKLEYTVEELKKMNWVVTYKDSLSIKLQTVEQEVKH